MSETEFGHEWQHGHLNGGPVFIDNWGVGPFIISVDGKTFRFEDSDRFGPSLLNKAGDIKSNPWPSAKSPFWRAHRIWKRQGRRLADDGIACIWDEPKPTVVQHMGGRHYLVVDNGEEDGRYITLPRVVPSKSGGA